MSSSPRTTLRRRARSGAVRVAGGQQFSCRDTADRLFTPRAQAHYVGMMRNGRLLAEAHPDHLMKELALPSLEEVFLHLCRHEEPSEAHTRMLALTKGTAEPSSASVNEDNERLPLLSSGARKVGSWLQRRAVAGLSGFLPSAIRSRGSG